MMRQFSHSATRLATLFGLAALLACSTTGCQCCAWTERYQDCVDAICDRECNAQRIYRPWYDLTRIGRVNWPWACCRKCPPPGFVYDTPVTNRVMSQRYTPEDEFGPPPTTAPPPLLPDDLWSTPVPEMNADDVGVAPLGPLFDPDSAPPAPIPADDPGPTPEPTPNEPQVPADESTSIEARQPTLAPPRVPVSSEIDAMNVRDDDWTRASGVVRLFDESNGDAPEGITIHQYDRSDFTPIALEAWLAGEPSEPSPIETASCQDPELPTAASSTSPVPWSGPAAADVPEQDPPLEVVPSSATQQSQTPHRASRAQWWEADSAPNTRTADDVFGSSPFAEWQSASE